MLFDIWIDMQRQWIYLDGIFNGSNETKHLLPNETQKFQSVSSEFLNLMKKIIKSSFILDILLIQGIQNILERLIDLLNKLQKSLSEYIERERNSFSRFYFIGDEDLLEMIGNSNNLDKIQKHLNKMFPGVNSFIINDSNIIGICSKEGEEVHFVNSISIQFSTMNIKEFLSLIDDEIKLTLATLLKKSVYELKLNLNNEQYLLWIEKYQAQLIVIAVQILWTELIENALNEIELNNDPICLKNIIENIQKKLDFLAESVCLDQALNKRKKIEHLIIELIHQRDITNDLMKKKVNSIKNFEWICRMRLYFNDSNINIFEKLQIKIAGTKFFYGFEYLGIQEKLVKTPLIDQCFFALTQALDNRLGGSPFGPAGTGKTESVKALGSQLGRFVIVFNCDESFDFKAITRIFIGICQVGAWGCFDEFNRLEETVLSSVSQQIQLIQEALKEKKKKIELLGKQVSLNENIAIFITMNPNYAARSHLPDNLKKLFRNLAMTQPESIMIAQVMLYCYGFLKAELLSKKICLFFKLCDEQLSKQAHYDFGLRSLKNILLLAGNLKRDHLVNINEEEILIQSIIESVVPRLIDDDLSLLNNLISDIFPGIEYKPVEIIKLKKEIKNVCQEMNLIDDDSWLEKVIQIYLIHNLNHGLMIVGPSGSGKSTAWRVLLKALSRLESNNGMAHVIDPKSMSKEDLYGTIDLNTREWTDGLFTHILRKIIVNIRGDLNKRQWIVFDGDVDPEWIESLNSILDDNKLFTLPNGERLQLPSNVRIIFEVQNLKYATLSTVSRCGMVWFSEKILTLDMIYQNYLNK